MCAFKQQMDSFDKATQEKEQWCAPSPVFTKNINYILGQFHQVVQSGNEILWTFPSFTFWTIIFKTRFVHERRSIYDIPVFLYSW